MKYKYYTANIACRDNRIRTLTITTDATDNTETKHIDVTSLQVQMTSDSNVFSPLRPQTGKITIVCNDDINPLDLMPRWSNSIKVNISRADGAVEFFGYVACETRSQPYPTDGELFDIPIASPLALANGIRVQIDQKLSLELDQIDELIADNYKQCGGSNEAWFIYPDLWEGCFTEKIPRYSSIEGGGDVFIENLMQEYSEPIFKTAADILTSIAQFYGVTFMEIGQNLVAIAPDSVEGINQHYLYKHIDSPSESLEYQGDLVFSSFEQIGYGTQDIENPPSLIKVSTKVENADNFLEFNANPLTYSLSVDKWKIADVIIPTAPTQKQQEDGSTVTINHSTYVKKLRGESYNHLMTAYRSNVIPSGTYPIPTGGSFNLFTNRYVDYEYLKGLAITSYVPHEHYAHLQDEDITYTAATLRSYSAISLKASRIKVTYTCSALAYSYAKSSLWWYYIDPTEKGWIEARVTVGNWRSDWRRPTYQEWERSQSPINSAKCHLVFDIPAHHECGQVSVEFKCCHIGVVSDGINWDNNIEFLFISDVGIAPYYIDDIPELETDILSNAPEEEYIKSLRFDEFTFKYPQGFVGEEYSVELPWSVHRPYFYCDIANSIFRGGQGADPFIWSDGLRQYEQDMLERLKTILCKPIVTLNIPIKIAPVDEYSGILPYMKYNNQHYLLTGYSRDYMAGTDTISITKI